MAVVLASRSAWAQEAEITVQGETRSPGQVTISGRKAAENAGTQADPVKVLQSLPGTGRGGIGGGDVVAWGSAPRESRLEIDGVEVPLLYHGSGVRSVLPAALVESVTFVPGAYGAEHGRALGGLVLLTTSATEPTEPHYRASADLLDATAMASAPLGADVTARAGLRYGYVDRWLPGLFRPELRGLFRVPSYWDAQAELSSPHGRVVFLYSSDESQTELASADPARRQSALETARFGRIYAQHRSASAGGEAQVTPLFGWDSSRLALDVGAEHARLETHALRYGVRAQHRASVTEHVTLGLGLDALGSMARVEREGSLAVPRREGDPYPFGTPPGDGSARDSFRAHVLGVAPFALAEFRWRGLLVSPALRFEPTLLEASRARPPLGRLPGAGTSRLEALVEPRLALEQRVSPSVRLFASAGRYHQPPDASDLGASFGNPELTPASATHLSFGESATLPSRTRIEVTVFGKWLHGLAVRNREPEPRLGRSLVPDGAGRAFGTQLLVRQSESHGFSGWLSATLSRSERCDADGVTRLSDFDSPLVVALSALQRLGSFRFGARARFASGAPRTPIVNAYYDLSSQRFEPVLGATNSTRLRDFFQLDLRLDRRFDLGSNTAIELYVDALNVTARKNEEEWAYASDFRRIASVSGLPPLVMVGLTVER